MSLSENKAEGHVSHTRLALFWALLAALSLIALYVRHIKASLDGDYQGWASASCMVMARAFGQLGYFATHFVPYQNNLPVGSDPDVYLHWPPLYPVALSFFLRVFGDAPSSGRLLALLITLATAALVFLIAQNFYTGRVALLSVFFFLTARAMFQGASALLQQPLALLFALLSVYCYFCSVRRPSLWMSAASLLAMVASIGSAWDTVFIPFGLLAGALLLKHRRGTRIALLLCVLTVLTFAVVEADYIWSYPALFANQFATIAYRMGLHFNNTGSLRLHTIVDSVHFEDQYGVINAYWRALKNVNRFFSPAVLIAGCVYIAEWWQSRRSPASEPDHAARTWIVTALLLPVVAWYVLMRNYVAIHDFPLVLAAPFLAISSGILLERLWTLCARNPAVFSTLAYIAPLILLHPLLIEWRDANVPPQRPQYADLSATIAQTPPSAVVLTTAESLIPTYYSGRHVVRGIESAQTLTLATALAHQAFPDTPVYFATRLQDAGTLSESLRKQAMVTAIGDSVLYRLQ